MSHHLILTQSTPPTKDTGRALNEMGFSFTHVPALSITYTNAPLNCPFPIKTLIATSKHSLHNIESKDLPQNIKILCVGQSTQEHLFEKEMSTIIDVFETGTHLIEEIKKSPSLYKNILYLRGKDVQHDLATICTSLGLKIHEHITYQSETNPLLQKKLHDAIAQNKPATLCVFSEKGAKTIAKLKNQQQHTQQEIRTNLLCLSQRMLNSLKQFDWERTLTCTHPTRQKFLLKLNDLKDTEKDL